MIKQFITALLFVFISCAPKAYVSVIRMGPVLEPRKADCEVVFLNEAQYILMNDYQYVGMIQVSGHNEEMAKINSQIPAFLQVEACRLGGNAISLNAAATTSSQSVLQIFVWTPKPQKAPSNLNNTPYRDL